ncbi:MAG: hypothetical protein CW691_10010 [Candidatus Bathyarchaeum sp.]|nr:MAG: hypothetical protein CW691_10010 [Candidatus Bathyarchaeum sp.]
MLGRYENFPENIHGVTIFHHQNPTKSLQQAIFCTFHRLNSELFDLGTVTPYLKQKSEVGFEFGVADGIDFNFLDQNELDNALRTVNETELETLDFFFAVRYHLIRDNGKRVPLRFDYHVLRFFFQEDVLEVRIRHEKGTQRVPLDELISFLVKQINVELSQRQLVQLFFGDFEKASIQ